MKAGCVARTDNLHNGVDEETGEQLLPVKCWCEWRYINVPARLVAAGQTLSCGKKSNGGCKP